MDNYWIRYFSQYKGNEDFIDGVMAGLAYSAFWEDGTHFIRDEKLPLKEVIADVIDQLRVK
jgi:hypothetical protein